MNSKKSKRAKLPREFTLSKKFIKDWGRLSRSGRYDMNRLKSVMMLLIENTAPLPPGYRDHALAGDWFNYRECHIGGDFLMIYRLDGVDASERIVFVRLGTHAGLFD
ncbi:MAG: type II toxin-antitoxin system YafQ family toxin [Methylococcales bacterium]